VSVGDRIQAIVVSPSGGIVLSRRGVRNTHSARARGRAFAGLAVEGKVRSVVKGGCERLEAAVAAAKPREPAGEPATLEKAWNSCSTKRGRPSPSRRLAACARKVSK
jgi:hypothetical protein